MNTLRATFRWMFHIIALLSLLLLIITPIVWIRQQSVSDRFAYTAGQTQLRAYGFRNSLVLAQTPTDQSFSPGYRLATEGYSTEAPSTFVFRGVTLQELTDPNRHVFQLLGLIIFADPQYTGPAAATLPAAYATFIAIPYPWLLIVFILPPLIWLLTLLRRRRKPGCCPQCGYDLRGSKGSCPECGATITAH